MIPVSALREPDVYEETLDVWKSVSLVQADCQYSPRCSLLVNMAPSGWFSWACLLKRDEFRNFIVMIMVSRVGVSVNVRIRVNF